MASTASTVTLRTVVFLGSARDCIPPWGGDARLGNRVLGYLKSVLADRSSVVGKDVTVKHEVTYYDPLEVFGEGGNLAKSGAEVQNPHFFLKEGQDKEMDAMRAVIKAADCYIVCSAEYNHSIPSALSGMLNHFGGSNFGYKPSAIVTYSSGPWGGMRAAMALRPWLSELGCIPISKLCGFPSAGELFGEDGKPTDPAARPLSQLPKSLTELEWMAVAMKNQRDQFGLPNF